VLAWLIAKGTWNFSQKRVLELGSGLGLAGLASAAWTDCNYVLLSDGDPELVDVMRQNIALNQQSNAFGEEGQLHGKVQAACIDFLETKTDADNKFDVILCADCVYDTGLHIHLLHKFRQCLRPDGLVILMAAPREHSLETFLNTAKAYFGSVNRSVDYNDEVRKKFRGAKCFPHLVLLDDVAPANNEEYSVFDDEVARRYIERLHTARLKEYGERAKIHSRYTIKREPVTTLKQNEVNSMINRVANPTNRVRKRFMTDCHVDRVRRSSVTSPGNSHGLKTTLSSRPASSPTFGKRPCDGSSGIGLIEDRDLHPSSGVPNVFVAVDGCATGPVCVPSDSETIPADVRKSTNNRPHAILASQMPKCPVLSTQYGPSGKELRRSLPRRGAASTRSKGVIGNDTSGNGELEGACSDAGNRILDMFRQYIQAEKAPKKRPVQPSWVLDRNLDGKFESLKYASIFRPKLPRALRHGQKCQHLENKSTLGDCDELQLDLAEQYPLLAVHTHGAQTSPGMRCHCHPWEVLKPYRRSTLSIFADKITENLDAAIETAMRDRIGMWNPSAPTFKSKPNGTMEVKILGTKDSTFLNPKTYNSAPNFAIVPNFRCSSVPGSPVGC
jgi:predicted nicotinamide N-methyase